MNQQDVILTLIAAGSLGPLSAHQIFDGLHQLSQKRHKWMFNRRSRDPFTTVDGHPFRVSAERDIQALVGKGHIEAFDQDGRQHYRVTEAGNADARFVIVIIGPVEAEVIARVGIALRGLTEQDLVRIVNERKTGRGGF